MRKLLQILAIVMLLLGAAALFLGIVLFNQRELLKGRTQALERSVVQVAALLEQPIEPPTDLARDFTEKDISEVATLLVPEPERATYWQDYPVYLENTDQPMFSINREDLKNYYKIDFATQRPMKDINGLKITEGAGTMDEVLKKFAAAAQYELERLNLTRNQLQAVREELVNTIVELNDGMQRQRQQLVEIQDHKNTIAQLEDDKRQLQTQVADLETEKAALQEEVAAKAKTIQEQIEDIASLNETIETQRKEIIALRTITTGGQIGLSSTLIKMEAGPKGRVVSVNPDWSYVVLELDDNTLAEIEVMREALLRQNTPGFPTIDLFLRRGDKYVSKIRVTQIKRDQKLAVADVLSDWQQADVRSGDVAFF